MGQRQNSFEITFASETSFSNANFSSRTNFFFDYLVLGYIKIKTFTKFLQLNVRGIPRHIWGIEVRAEQDLKFCNN